MAFVHGKGAVFKIDNAAGVLQVLTTFVDSVEVKNTVDTAESTTMGAEAKTYLSGQSDCTISVKGKFEATAATGPDPILSGLIGLEASSTYEAGPEGSAAGKVKYTGECFLTTYTVSAPVGDVCSFTADFQGTGAQTRTTWP